MVRAPGSGSETVPPMDRWARSSAWAVRVRHHRVTGNPGLDWARNLLHLGVPKCAEEDGVYLVFLVGVLQFLSTCPIGVRI